MINKDKLKEYASTLMFDMSDKEYELFAEEFNKTVKQIETISNIDNIKDVEPLIYPFVTGKEELREDEILDYLTVDEVLANTSHQIDDQVKVPKVVE
ncbi:MAG: Asp-tRNA(Asn)/Glu-tRNA(Gln) amidotransferase subunit GatC [Bacilli bacterium]|nr:Asp-tRNA(Asn)/Glu-tRNA(Gln) amidotransferase subunit GatC [Bacilli bacterium]